LDELEPLVALVNTSVPGTDAFFNGAQGKNLWISLILSTSKGSLAVDRDLEDSGSLPAFFLGILLSAGSSIFTAPAQKKLDWPEIRTDL
jgi:uncharacterized protein (DUF39 family)